eukprot:CAMPEP_0201620904 /NCGR_PEP_ID=MMETSP0492-20130828/45386_1 /ASSEMBLY_ACC=CAM_ASM_000837 /TAXON_ID=420259 /ORGANISM="Thalassiosira gravida, Strain GMp14c1" /LENGTH=64 /DNA_ID=CAMNT_0048090253 /DNA_START=282 /DNA_END=473 /DNA_ORIENTATION=-
MTTRVHAVIYTFQVTKRVARGIQNAMLRFLPPTAFRRRKLEDSIHWKCNGGAIFNRCTSQVSNQ